MDDQSSPISRRGLLKTAPLVAATGLAGCTGLTGDDATPTPTLTPDPPNIERQTFLRDAAAVKHVRNTVSGEITSPDFDFYNRVDSDLLGRWERSSDTVEFYDDLTFLQITDGTENTGSYYTAAPSDFIALEYDSGEYFEYFYEITTDGDADLVDFYDSTDGEYLFSYQQTVDGQDGRDVVDVFSHVTLYRPEGAETLSQELTSGSHGSGFIVSPDGYVVTNAHVVGTHRNPEDVLYYRLALDTRRTIREAVAQGYDLSDSDLETVTGILTTKLLNYYGEHSSVTEVSTDIGVLSGTAAPTEDFEPQSWPASIEAAGTVFEEVDGEPTHGRDVAVLKVDEQEPLPTVRLGDSTNLGTGADVFAIGYPDLGLEEVFEDRNVALEPTLTSGVVSARRTLTTGVETIQTDAGINNGNSGGPLYDDNGEVVGIATFKPRDVQVEEVGFALPIETAEDFLDDLGVVNEPGELTTTYEEGLDALWRDDCNTLEEKMDEVLELWPDHPYAEEVLDEC